MFSVVETDGGGFLYRCHGCGSERVLTATETKIALEQAFVFLESHKCAPKATPTRAEKTPKAS